MCFTHSPTRCVLLLNEHNIYLLTTPIDPLPPRLDIDPPLRVKTAFFGATTRVLPSPSCRNTFSTQRTPFPLLPLSLSATHGHLRRPPHLDTENLADFHVSTRRGVETAFFGATARVLPSPSCRNTFSTQRTPFPLLPLSPSATHVHPLILTLKTWPISAVFVVLGPRHEKHGRNGHVSSLLTLRSSKWAQAAKLRYSAMQAVSVPISAHPTTIERDPTTIEQSQLPQIMPTTRSSLSTTRSGRPRASSPPPKRKRSNAADQMRKRPKNVTDDEDGEEEVVEKKGKGGRVGKKTKKREKKAR